MTKNTHTTETAVPLDQYANAARQMESVLRDVGAVLDAIIGGGLLDAAPTDPADYLLHNAATGLLWMAKDRVKAWEDDDGVDLSISLSVLASAAGKAVAHG